jgi:Zn-dependent peptidase ImmA (M78 family)
MIFMLELKTAYTLSQIPYLTYDSLDNYAEQLVRDFAPNAIETPGVLDVDSFMEFYLNLHVEFHQLCFGRNVLGITAFSDGTVDVLNEETGMSAKLPVTTGTVVLDTSLCSKRNVPRLRFTMLHEGSHWLLHRKAFDKKNPFGVVGAYENRYIAAKEGRVDYSRSRKEKTNIDYMERQADFLSSAILMNRPALRLAYREFFATYDEKPRQVVRKKSPQDDCFAKLLPEYVAKTFGVSKRAALIRLEKLDAIVN